MWFERRSLIQVVKHLPKIMNAVLMMKKMMIDARFGSWQSDQQSGTELKVKEHKGLYN